MNPLWTSAAAETATGGLNTRPWQAMGVSIDTRTLAPGDLFVALAGPRVDGHDFLGDAFAHGAGAAMVHRRPPGSDNELPLLIVRDTMAALDGLGVAARKRSGARIVAVTGSVGKTGSKEALRLALGRLGPTHASAGSLNNQWGVPLSLARMPADAKYGVFELGMNHPGEIAALSRLVRPEIALITTIEPAHLGFFPSVAAIADAKAEIFLGMNPRGVAILNRDNEWFGRLETAARGAGLSRIYGFGAHQDAAIRLVHCDLHATASAVTVSIEGSVFDYCIAAPGRHWVMNSLGVLGAIHAAGGDIATAAAAFAEMKPLEGRGRRHRIAMGQSTAELIDESYNASPASMRAAISVLAAAQPGPGGRRIAILGDMLELGDRSAALHAALAEPLAAAGIDLVLTVGEESAALDSALPKEMRGGHDANAKAMAERAAGLLRAGDVVTVKGSHGLRLDAIVARLVAAPAEAVKG
ncbi:MAG TPA: UDP-N-acetylmuramoyl-tripeptide--D-alanyl-D-alanine ligase [Stellaceae bacterium]|jgi:UDP-N-acetylmuramoyl-tripeptide--D-alanyl-D-alanine ligase|nr:UDP-N-acetylmuramoyl-tripeptide--D-alanyl-D-alanine ligase [Stellaceae bacterium]